MQDETTPNAAKTFATRILDELRGMRLDLNTLAAEVSTLTECANLLLLPEKREGTESGKEPGPKEEAESPLQAMMTVLGLLIAGTEETRAHLEAMNEALFDKKMAPAFRVAID